MTLTARELARQKRHILLKEIGGVGVKQLKAAHVSIIGAGALGGPCALYLAAAGVGRITLIDDDVVEASNLQRQIQFEETDCGQSKVARLAARLAAQNPDIEIDAISARFGKEAIKLGGRILIDATDNFATRFALNKVAHESGRLLVSGAATGWQGQVSVFASGVQVGAPCYQCFVPEEPPNQADCETQGVVGAVTGIIGAQMALATVKAICGITPNLIGRIWVFDGLAGKGRILKLLPDPACKICGLN